VQLSARGLLAGAGSYHLEGAHLDRYRKAVDEDASGPELERVVAALRRARVDVHGTDPLKTAPQGYPKDHPRIELLRFRGIVAVKAWPPAAWLGTPEAGRRVAGLFRTAAPLVDWLTRNVGPTDRA
jgi:uncharacterized protein (DUF2461 family)